MDLSVGVLFGGPSAEAEVSRSSAQGVAAALRDNFSDVQEIELTPQVASQLVEAGIDVVFPALHGPPGEDGTLQGALEIAGVPYVGSAVLASAVAMQKSVARSIFATEGLPIAKGLTVTAREPMTQSVKRIADELGSSVVVKPSGQGSALGVTFCEAGSAIEAALKTGFTFNDEVLVEACVTGREVTVGILEREDVEVLPAIEIRTPDDSWYDYEHRYTEGLSEHVIPPSISNVQQDAVRDIGRRAHIALGCRDLSRADLIVPETGSPILLEVNTLPGMTPTSLFPDAAAAAGIPFPDLVAGLVRRAWERSPGQMGD